MSEGGLGQGCARAPDACGCSDCAEIPDARRASARFEPADTARHVAARLDGMRWNTVARGPIDVVSAAPGSLEWPISVRVTVSGAPWTREVSFEARFSVDDTFAGATCQDNAQGLAEDAMILIEEYLETGPVGRLTLLA